MSKYKTVRQRNRRAAFILGITEAEYVERLLAGLLPFARKPQDNKRNVR